MSTVSILVMLAENTQRREAERRKARELELASKITQLEELEELEELIAEAKEEAEKIKDELKEEMYKRNVEEMTIGKYIVRWTEVLSNRFDSTAFKKAFPTLYKDFTKGVASRRFSISE